MASEPDVDYTAIVERAAFLEYCCHVPRIDADRRAMAEFYDGLERRQPAGIVGELISADSRRHHADLQHILAAAGLLNRRAPAWGVSHIEPDGNYYRPAASGELGHAAIIAPAAVNGSLIDLVAQDLATGRMHTRLGIAATVGADEIEQAKVAGRPLLVFASITAWLRSGTRGAVVVDWLRAGADLDGIRAAFAPAHLAQHLHDATARCWPRPVIAVPDQSRSLTHAA